MLGTTKLTFVDTNIWLYLFIQEQDARKHDLAVQAIGMCEPIVSVQVINEVCVNLRRKALFPESDIRRIIDSFYQQYPVVPLTQATLLDASRWRELYKLSFWDGLIVSTAVQSGATVIFSEDMQNGLVINNQVKIINPIQA